MAGIPCDIVLIPDDKLTDKAIVASRLLSVYGSLFTLEMGKFYPHMSLYMFQFDEAEIESVESEMRRIAARTAVITERATKYTLGEGYGMGYVDPEYETSADLELLQRNVIDTINPLRAGMRESDKAKLQDASGLKLENLRQYGYPYVGKLFRPHITLTRLIEHHPQVLDLLPNIHDFDGSFTKLGLFQMSDHGTCVQKILEFELTGGNG